MKDGYTYVDWMEMGGNEYYVIDGIQEGGRWVGCEEV